MLGKPEPFETYLRRCLDGIPVMPARSGADAETVRLVYDHTAHIRSGKPSVMILEKYAYAEQVSDEPHSYGIYRPNEDKILLRRYDRYTNLSVGLHEIAEGEFNKLPNNPSSYYTNGPLQIVGATNHARQYLDNHLLAVEAQIALVENAEQKGKYRGLLRERTWELLRDEEEALDRLRHRMRNSLPLRWGLRRFF